MGRGRERAWRSGASRSRRRGCGWCAAWLISCLVACRAVRDTVGTSGAKAREFLGDIEPTGVVAATGEQESTWAAIRRRVEELDIEGFNRAVAELQSAVAHVSRRLEALPPERFETAGTDFAASITALRRQLEEAALDEAVHSVRQLALTFDAKVQQLDADRINAAISEWETTARQLRETIARLDPRVETALVDSAALAAGSRERIDAVPTDEFRDTMRKLNHAVDNIDRTVATLPATAERLDAALRSARTTFRVATGVGIAAGLAVLLWLVRLIAHK